MDAFELQDELNTLAQDSQNYEIPNERDFSTEDPTRLLEAAVEAVANSSSAITDPEVFDVFRSVLKHSSSVSGTIMNKILDSITSGLQGELESTLRDIESGDQEACLAHKLPLEQFAFLLHWFVTVAADIKRSDDHGPPAPTQKAKRGRGGKTGGGRSAKSAAAARLQETFSWDTQIPPTFGVISKVIIRVGTHWQRIWAAMTEKEAFISCLVKPAYHVLENEQYMKASDIRMAAQKVICLSVKHHNQVLAANTNIIQNLQFYDHLPEPLADLLHILASSFDHTQLGDDILREIAGKTFNAQDSKGPRNFSKFLIKYAEHQPRSVLKQLSLLLAQLDSEAYPMRIAMVEVLGYLIRELAGTSDDNADFKQTQKQIAGLFDLLLERALDTSSYVRTKVFSALSRVFDIKVPKFPKQRLRSARIAAESLEDKASTVRKAAVSLLTKLLITHPYGMMHGGTLQADVWETEYEAVKAQLSSLEAKIGKAVEVQDEDEEAAGEQKDANGDEEDDEDEVDGDDEGSPKKKKAKKARKSRGEGENAMDVDKEGDEGASTEEDSDSDDEQDDSMSVDGEEGEEGSSEKKKKSKKASKLKPRKSELNFEALTQEQAALSALEADEHLRLKLKKKYYAEAMTFIRLLDSAMENLKRLLGSTNKAEVLETMEFFRVALEYQLKDAQDGIQKMIHLIWTKDNTSSVSGDGEELKGIRQRLLEVYSSLYFEVPEEEEKARVNSVARNLIELTYDCSLAEITSLEEMLRIMMESHLIPGGVVAKLWQIYGINKNIPPSQRRGAIMILGMLAVADKGIVEDQIETMLKVGFGKIGSVGSLSYLPSYLAQDYLQKDLQLARYTCVALQRLGGSAKKVKGSLKEGTLRYPMNDRIFTVLAKMIEKPSRDRDWFQMAEHIINTVYALSKDPSQWAKQVLISLAERAFAPRDPANENDGDRDMKDVEEEQEGSKDEDKPAGDEDEPDLDGDGDVSMSQPTSAFTQASQNDSSEKEKSDAFRVSQLVSVIGHIALKELVFLETVEREWKRQKDEKLAEEKKAKGAKSSKDKDGEELDQVVGNAEDEIGDRMHSIRHEELLYGENALLASFAPIVVEICRRSPKYKDPLVRNIATVALGKLLCISSRFCEENLPLLFKILETSKDATIRSNVVIALGDITLSFSNIVDENSHELYRGLSDGVVQVKKNTLMVLTHLILNAMIKVKGQLGEMAKCLEDKDGRIQDLAKLFFKELSTKENAIYNNLPDVISHLSTGDHAVPEEEFQKILQYIFTFIDKEKQAENIVEKLCQRFRFSEDPRQWRDIAYCLSLLPFKSEKSAKKLIEGLQYYRDKLHEPGVYGRFEEILVKILEEHKAQGEEDQAFEKKIKKKAAKKRGTRKAPPRRKASNRQSVVEEDDDE
ncbi:hypothetical protein D9756_006855 [Leucocoprinus leucothites]|uniref:Condensin complex subunit 1 n=1 Tax=Leucocoprinus leucothites TaxID=201217 RepID=A0A8H5G2Q2_9AGAR|nr:hypothetical protein D9756_006855 [Leucoagaricus leucothites]